METTCQASYPLNSENESPFGTFTVYLSCAEMAQPPTKASTPVIIGIVSILLPFITSTSFMKFSILTSSFTSFLVLAHSCALEHFPQYVRYILRHIDPPPISYLVVACVWNEALSRRVGLHRLYSS